MVAALLLALGLRYAVNRFCKPKLANEVWMYLRDALARQSRQTLGGGASGSMGDDVPMVRHLEYYAYTVNGDLCRGRFLRVRVRFAPDYQAELLTRLRHLTLHGTPVMVETCPGPDGYTHDLFIPWVGPYASAMAA
jgi:hypothetical protein